MSYKYRVKFIDNKSHWYSCEHDCEIGDVVYCTGKQENVLGRIVETKKDILTTQKIRQIVCNIDSEDTKAISAYYQSLDYHQRETVVLALGGNAPFYRAKFMSCVSNFWTVKGSEGMSWEEFLPFVRKLAKHYVPPIEEHSQGESRSGGFLWERIEALPEAEQMYFEDLMLGVVYGTADMIRKAGKTYQLNDIIEYRDGIFRAEVNNAKIMEDYPELKCAFFSVGSGTAHAVYSESGYSFLTKYFFTPLYFSRSAYVPYIMKYHPDEVFRDTTFGQVTSKMDVSFNAPFSAEFDALDYIVEREDGLYRMTGTNPNDSPVSADSEWSYTIDGQKAVIVRYKGKSSTVVFPTELEGKKVIGIRNRFGQADESYENIRSVVIPEGYELIGAYTFCGCKNLTHISIPDTVKKIGDGAFLKCSKLAEIRLPAGLEGIVRDTDDLSGGQYMFRYCRNLKYVMVPEGLQYKEACAFEEGTCVCLADYQVRDADIRTWCIDACEKDMDMETLQVYAGQTLTIRADKGNRRIELYTLKGQYAGCAVRRKDYIYKPDYSRKEYPDGALVKILSEKLVDTDDLVIEAEVTVLKD